MTLPQLELFCESVVRRRTEDTAKMAEVIFVAARAKPKEVGTYIKKHSKLKGKGPKKGIDAFQQALGSSSGK